MLFAALWSGCGEKTSFRLSGEVHGGANTNIYIKYFSGDAIHSGVTAARSGKLEGEFPLPSPAVVHLLDNEGNLLALMYAEGGDELSVKIDRSNPAKSVVEGSDVNERWSGLMNANSELLFSADSEKINDMIEDYISANPSDVVSALMFASFYDASSDPVHAGEVLETIDTEARRPEILDSYTSQLRRFAMPDAYEKIDSICYRPADKDTSLVFYATNSKASLIAISNDNSRRNDSIVPPLKRLYKALPEDKAQILDLALTSQYSAFSNRVRRDSAEWVQGWVPGGILGDDLYRLAIPEIPYFIVTDTAGNQIFRGGSFADAEVAITDYVKDL